MKNLLRYLGMRLLMTIPMLLILLTVVFLVLRVLPGDPISAMLGDHAPVKFVAEKKHELGLDRPIWEQYVTYLWNLSHGDLGMSMILQEKVTTPILEKLPATVELTFVGLLVALGIGIPLGAWAAKNRRSVGDFGSRLYGNIVYCIPVFWMGLILQMIFGVALDWLPIAGRVGSRVLTSDFETTGFYLLDTLLKMDMDSFTDVVAHLILPSLTLGVTLSGIFLRLTRANMLDSLKSDFVLAGRARGLPEGKVVYGHALGNAFVPVLTMLGLQFAVLLAGAILTETTFSWPGMGRLLLERIYLRDYPTVQGIIVIFALFVSLISLLVDVIHALIDPRVKY
ncbi:MAG TPA: ABC transporter permease [Spirochaetia bacterium]|jgi:peptide/nickel transport system permease protein|nr:ABC transporter permease [Spirochaetia bacterium]